MINSTVEETEVVARAAGILRPGVPVIVTDGVIDWRDCKNPPTDHEIAEVLNEARKEILLDELRARRNALLAACDWTQAADAPVDVSAWADYRQALRDLPSKTADPENPVWPEPPTV